MKKIILLLVLFFYLGIVVYPQMGDYALKFNGTDNYVSTDYTTMLNTFTIECWVRGDAAPGTAKVSGIVHKEKNFHIVWDHTEAARVGSAIIHTGGAYHHASYGTLEANVWYHLAATYDGETLRAYKNGQLVGTNVSPSGNPTSETLSLKLGSHADPQPGRYFAGNIDEVRIWNTVRSEADIKANMYRSVATDASGLIHYFKMSNGSGTTLSNDQSGSSTPCTLQGTNASSMWVPTGCFAGPRNSLLFNGLSDHVSFSSSPSYNNSTLTLEAWIKSASTSVEREIMGWGQNSTNDVVEFRMSDRKLQFGIDNIGWQSVTGTTNINTDSWNHVALVKNGSSISLYVNGKLDNTGTINLNPTVSVFRIATLFKNTGNLSYYFPGNIDEVRIWHRVLTAAEIQEGMFRSLDGNEAGLVAYYRMDHYDGTTLFDITSGNRHGTLSGAMSSNSWKDATTFNTWIGEVSSDWSTPRNWSRNAVPGSTDNVGLYKWTSIGNDAAITGTPQIRNLFFSSSSNPALSANMTLFGNLILGRDLNINSQQIQLWTEGYLVEGNFRLSATTGRIYTIRPLNNISSLNVAGLGAILTTSVNMGSTEVSRYHAEITQGLQKSILRSYYIQPLTNNGLNATLAFSYHDGELNGITEGNLGLYKSSDGTTWTKQIGTTLNTTLNTATIQFLNNFSYWTLADQNDPLPVELSAFNATVSGKSVTLNWRTETEVANYGFDVERKAVNSSDWNRAGFVPGNGNSNSPKQYQFTDSPAEGKYFYRLKQIDNDGTVTYSHEIEVEVGTIPDQYALLQNYPNPFNPATQIQYHLPESGMVSLKVYDMLGSEVAVLVQEIQSPGVYTVNYDASGISSGLYFFRLQAGKFTEVKKMMLTR